MSDVDHMLALAMQRSKAFTWYHDLRMFVSGHGNVTDGTISRVERMEDVKVARVMKRM